MSSASSLADPFNRIFLDQAEADWAFDLFRETARRLRVTSAYDQRLAATLSERSGRLQLRLNFGGWLVVGVRGPGQVPERIDLALLAEPAEPLARLAPYRFERKEGRPEVRTYNLPLEVVRPLTSDLRDAYEATLDVIADKFQHWRRATHWKQHTPEIIEAAFDPERRLQLLATGLSDIELLYEPQLRPFAEELVLAEDEAGYQPGATPMNTSLSELFSQIFTDRAEAEWAFELMRESCHRLGVTGADDPRLAVYPVTRFGGVSLHLNIGAWLVLAFRPPELAHKRVRLPLLVTEDGPFGKSFIEYEFEPLPDTPSIAGYGLPLAAVQQWRDGLRPLYEQTLALMAPHLAESRPAEHHRRQHRPELAAAIFDVEARERLLREEAVEAGERDQGGE